MPVTNGSFDLFKIVSIFDSGNVPAVGFESLRHVFGKSKIGEPFDRDMIVVIEINQFAEFQVTGERCRFRSDALHQIAVRHDCIDVMID